MHCCASVMDFISLPSFEHTIYQQTSFITTNKLFLLYNGLLAMEIVKQKVGEIGMRSGLNLNVKYVIFLSF